VALISIVLSWESNNPQHAQIDESRHAEHQRHPDEICTSR